MCTINAFVRPWDQKPTHRSGCAPRGCSMMAWSPPEPIARQCRRTMWSGRLREDVDPTATDFVKTGHRDGFVENRKCFGQLSEVLLCRRLHSR